MTLELDSFQPVNTDNSNNNYIIPYVEKDERYSKLFYTINTKNGQSPEIKTIAQSHYGYKNRNYDTILANKLQQCYQMSYRMTK